MGALPPVGPRGPPERIREGPRCMGELRDATSAATNVSKPRAPATRFARDWAPNVLALISRKPAGRAVQLLRIASLGISRAAPTQQMARNMLTAEPAGHPRAGHRRPGRVPAGGARAGRRVADHLAAPPARPVWQPLPDDLRAAYRPRSASCCRSEPRSAPSSRSSNGAGRTTWSAPPRPAPSSASCRSS
jgi:hypothetical protein